MGKGYAGKDALLYGTGASTAMTDEACTEVSGTVFQITATAKRILDHEVSVVVKANTVVQSGNYTIDRNFGIITFTDGTHTGETVTVTTSYLPRFLWAKLTNWTLSDSYDVVDSTCIGDDAEDNTLTTRRASLSIETIDTLDTDLYTDTTVEDIFESEDVKVFELQPMGASERVIRVRARLTGKDWAVPVNDIIRVSLTAQGSAESATLISRGTI